MAELQVRTAALPPPPKEYVLTLSEAEARAVRTLVGSVCGQGPFREACNAVWEALDGELHGEECADVDVETVIEVNESMNLYVVGK